MSKVESEIFRTFEISDPMYEREGLRLATVKSQALGRRGDVTLWVPPGDRIGTLLILLHGMYGSHWSWTMKGGAHHTAQRIIDSGEIAPMVIAMPSDGLGRDGSGYLDWPGAEQVERWIVEEVPAVARLAAPALRPDSQIAIAGLSMGGYGALRLGSKYAERFCAISAHSTIAEVAQIAEFVEEPLSDYFACGGREQLSASYWLSLKRESLPPLRFDCGVDDSLIDGNRALHHLLQQESIPHEYFEFPGAHDWPYWQEHLAETLRHVDRHARKGKNG